MFDSKTSLTTRLADAVDLMLDFATLGEYGLEPVDRGASCESRRRQGYGSATRSRSTHSGRAVATRSR